jgi:very-short-patch-repair endonuclease
MPHVHPEIRRRARKLGKNQTPEKAILWSRLRNRRLNGLKFYRQRPIGPYIADFYCAQHRLVIELDGGGHLRRQTYDQRRTEWLNAQFTRSSDLQIKKFAIKLRSSYKRS